MMQAFRLYLLPGFVFMAVVIGGGYSTGRELVQFFLPSGPTGGLLGMAVTAALWSAVLAVSFELARQTRSYDYKAFITELLGPAWPLFEVAYFALLVLVLAVLGAAAGSIVQESLGLPALWGTLTMMAAVAVLVFYGSTVLERLLAGFALLLYGVYGVIVVWSLSHFGDRIAENFASVPPGTAWILGGLKYAGYNSAVIPAVLFCLHHQTRRREALVSGLIAGPVAILPGVLLYVAMMGCYPEIGDAEVPLNYLLGQLQAPWFQHLFQIILFGIMIKTGTALLHSINERVAGHLAARGRPLPQGVRPMISLAILVVSVFAATAIGLVDLIARGYGGLSWCFIALLVVPLLTVGLWKIRHHKTSP